MYSTSESCNSFCSCSLSSRDSIASPPFLCIINLIDNSFAFLSFSPPYSFPFLPFDKSISFHFRTGFLTYSVTNLIRRGALFLSGGSSHSPATGAYWNYYIRLFITKTNTAKIQTNGQTDRQTNKHYN